jgi:hypothetical protein
MQVGTTTQAPPLRSEPRGQLGRRQAQVRDQAIDLLRWLGVFGVILQHSDFQSRYSATTLDRLAVLRHVFGWCVLFFFTASGYGARIEASWSSQARKRALRLLPPYVVVSCIAFGALAVATKLHLTRLGNPLSVTTLLTGLVTLQGFGPQLYFLPYLLVISLATLALFQRVGIRAGVLVLSALAVLQWCVWGLPSGSTGANPDRVLLYALAYALGCAMRSEAIVPRAQLLIVASLITAASLGMMAFGMRAEALLQLTVPFWLWWGLRASERWGKLPVVTASGTGAVYLWHGPVVLPTMTVLLSRLGLADFANFFTAVLLTVIVCLGIERVARSLGLERFLTL